MKEAYVYILANKKKGTLYVGVTSNLIKRVYQHKADEVEGFTKEHNIKNLGYYESTSSMITALEREKQLKKWNRAWKIRLIEEFNPTWDDLYNHFN